MLGRLPERDLLALLQRSTVRTLQSRKEIFSCGDAGRTVIAVLEGLVKLSTTSVGGREVVLDIVVPGACFGELAVLNNWARDTDAVTISRCRLLVIDGRQFNQVMERSAEGSQAMIRLLSERLRAARQRVVDAVVLPAPARLAKELIDLAEAQYTVVRDGARIKLPLSQAELGGMTGLTRESINKNLAALRDAGWIALGGGAVTLLDVEALRDLPREHDGRSGRATANGRGARSVFAGPPFSVCDPAIQPRP
jgi:CRP-like cAMP-binding protein